MSVPAFIGSARQSLRVTAQAIAGIACVLESEYSAQLGLLANRRRG